MDAASLNQLVELSCCQVTDMELRAKELLGITYYLGSSVVKEAFPAFVAFLFLSTSCLPGTRVTASGQFPALCLRLVPC